MEPVLERLKNLLVLILEILDSESEDSLIDRRRVQEYVIAAGYDPSEVDMLLDWIDSHGSSRIESRWLESIAEGDATNASVRLFGDDEREFLSPPAFGYLLDLCSDGQISQHQMESVIQYASLVSIGPMSRKEVGTLLDQVVFTSNEWGSFRLPECGFESEH